MLSLDWNVQKYNFYVTFIFLVLSLATYAKTVHSLSTLLVMQVASISPPLLAIYRGFIRIGMR
jgi:hypothetical protein